ncbi:AraC family transcriptional regulator [Paenibacillus sp. MMS20-IR301]|uniref:AraC family transcriptional regulator n=1 Tax=Paenibacillus sp. MMS20-IR301 TaxID=2895946 RepID=UPI0028EAAE82|nr:AraC family transcriptional regulator [Paenibacillus sp. MMS20-IR301]WNS41046.1 AraC family transcriptional regulator [Paenibacillus sp. MMS20-IR301]
MADKLSTYIAHTDNPITAGNGYKPPNLHRWGPGVRDVHALHYIVNGRGFYEVNGVTYTLEAGESFIIFPDTEVSYYPDPEDPWEYVWVEFKGTEAVRLLSMTNFTAQAPVAPGTPQSLEPLFNVSSSSAISLFEQERSNARLYLLLTYYIEYFSSTGAILKADYLTSAREYIERNFWNSSLSVLDIVSYVNVERSYLFRLFKDKTGMSISGYLTAFRIQRACGLLSSTSLSVKSVAVSVGYTDPLYFSKVFKKVTSLTPSAYKGSVTRISGPG